MVMAPKIALVAAVTKDLIPLLGRGSVATSARHAPHAVSGHGQLWRAGSCALVRASPGPVIGEQERVRR